MLWVRKEKDKLDKDGFIPPQDIDDSPLPEKYITEHKKSIVGGKLYDTETEEYIMKLECGRLILKTQLGII